MTRNTPLKMSSSKVNAHRLRRFDQAVFDRYLAHLFKHNHFYSSELSDYARHVRDHNADLKDMNLLEVRNLINRGSYYDDAMSPKNSRSPHSRRSRSPSPSRSPKKSTSRSPKKSPARSRSRSPSRR